MKGAKCLGCFSPQTHINFGHKLMARDRGFYSHDEEDNPPPKDVVEEAVYEMDMLLIANWNSRVTRSQDIVYHLGDFSFRNASQTMEIISQLNGRIRLVRGNHDRVIKGKVKDRFEWVKDYHEAKAEDGTKIVLSHYAFLTWNKSHYGAWNLHGHSHGSLEFKNIKQLDVGVDTNDFTPYSMEEVKAIMSERGFIAVDHHK